jgi:hypothetical protein
MYWTMYTASETITKPNQQEAHSRHTSVVLISSRDGLEYIADSFHWWDVSISKGSWTIV